MKQYCSVHVDGEMVRQFTRPKATARPTTT